jgi:HNH endonuclease
MTQPTLTVERLRAVLDYNPETGEFRWKERQAKGSGWYHKIFNTQFAGKPAGCPDVHGYIQIMIDQRNYKAHRLAWLWTHGSLPADKEIDHRDRNPANNVLGHLRLATRRQQVANTGPRKPGHPKGCYWSARDKKWSAWIYIDGRKVSLGAFKRLENARAARFQAEAKYHGEWAYTAEPERRAA